MDRKDVFTSLFLKAAAVTIDSENIKQYKSLWWYSTRDKSEGGLRLTQLGIDFIQTESEIKTYRIELPKDMVVGPQILIWLDQFLDSPFYLDKKFITVLSEKTAFELYLFSGDVKKMGASKAMNKRINQNSPSEHL